MTADDKSQVARLQNAPAVWGTPSDYLLTNIIGLYAAQGRGEGLGYIEPPIFYGLDDYRERHIEWAKNERLCFWEKKTSPDKPTYVVFHGINGHWGGCMLEHGDGTYHLSNFRVEWLKHFPKDANVIAVSMPGFGDSYGQPSRQAFQAANRAILEYLTQELGVEPSNIVAAGESLGANHALNFAAQASAAGKPIKQVTAVTPFTTIADAAAHVTDLGPWIDMKGKQMIANALFGTSNHAHNNIEEIYALKGSGTKLLIVSAELDEVLGASLPCQLAAHAIGSDLDVAFQKHEGAAHTEWDPSAVMAADARLREWGEFQLPSEVEVVPPLPAVATQQAKPKTVEKGREV